MRGARKNYGKRAQSLRITIRLYGTLKEYVEAEAEKNKMSVQDVILARLEEQYT